MREHLLDALKAAIATPGEHRLFRSGKLPGLFPTRIGPAAEAAVVAVKDGLLETARTEVKGKVVVEWVQVTPRGVSFVHDHDSPKAVLRELKGVLGASRAGVPEWLDGMRAEVAALSQAIESRAAAMLARLDALAERVDGALRRAELEAPGVAEAVGQVVPWAMAALEYLDRRKAGGGRSDCPLPELFQAMADLRPDLTLGAFQAGARRLHDARAVQLLPAPEMPEPEHAIVVDGRLAYVVRR